MLMITINTGGVAMKVIINTKVVDNKEGISVVNCG